MHGSGNGSEEAGSGSRDQYAAIALRRDEEDTLAHFRDRFHCAPRQVYLDGNSLGLLSIDSEEAVLRVLREWRDLGVSGWLEGDPPWFLMADQLARDTAPLIGAAPHQVAVTNSTTVNLHQLLATLFEPDGERTVILADALNFPSDLYALRSHLRLRGLDPAWHLRLVASRDGLTLDEADIIHAMTPDVGMALLPSVLYASGQLLDMERCPKALGAMVKVNEIQFHHEVTNQYLWGLF